MSAFTGPKLDATQATPTNIENRFRGRESTTPTGLYAFRMSHNSDKAVRLWVDNEYDGGGWTLVLNNNQYTGGMNNLKYDDAINKANYRTGGSDDSTNNVTILKNSYGLGDFNCWVGLKYWSALANKKTSGKITVVQIVASSPVELNDTANHTYRAEWTFTGWSSTYGMENKAFVANLKGTTTPGFYSYHASNRSLTTYDNDQDGNSGNCATYYNNNPFWYGSCWSGNYFAGGGYADRPYWNSSGGDNHAYGAVYIK
jgi:hypothetical protein|tara:strand:- start:687 stop:1457 length:771 start_codon:yes stop_codon:yes gene_type:complete